MGAIIIEKILTDIKTTKRYAIIVNEATDISHTEKCPYWSMDKLQV